MQDGKLLRKFTQVMLMLIGVAAEIIGLVCLMELCSVLQDDSGYRWGMDGGLTWKYANEMTYLLSLAAEVFLYGAVVLLTVRALRQGRARRAAAVMATMAIAILSTWFDLDRPFVEILMPYVS